MPELFKESTPLHAASQYSQSSCVKLLLDNGADIEIRDARGLSPLDVAGEVVHRPDDCEHYHEDNTETKEGFEGLDDIGFAARSKKSSFVPAAVYHIRNDVGVDTEKYK